MEPGQQLELFAAPKGGGVPNNHWSAAAQRNKSARPGAQLELPIPGDVLSTRSTTAPPEKTPDQKLRAGAHPIDSHHGGTYPMFMTGPEIRHQFQALDGDRYDEPDYQDSWRPDGLTIRGTRTAPNAHWYGVNKTAYDSYDGEKRLGVTRQLFHTGQQVPSLRAPLSKLPETDEDLYQRKYDEADHDEDAWHEDYDMPMPGRGLVEALGEHGYDWNHPVHLADGTGRGDNYSGGPGTFGKYQVLGGHHRIAVMSEDHPRQFLPVQWHPTFPDARESPNYY